MEIKTWSADMSEKETSDLAYWERNMLALHYANGWYNDDALTSYPDCKPVMMARYLGWRRVLSLENGKVTFHIPDDFNVGSLPQIERNWDGHTTYEKWKTVGKKHGVFFEEAKK